MGSFDGAWGLGNSKGGRELVACMFRVSGEWGFCMGRGGGSGERGEI